MDTRISTQSNTIAIQETNLTFENDKIIFVFYIRNDFSTAIIGCRFGKIIFLLCMSLVTFNETQ